MPDRDWQAEVALLRERESKSRQILGLPDDADRAAVRRAFRRASLACHPDANAADPEAARRFHLVCCAYRFLIGGEACEALDAFRAGPEPRGRARRGFDNPWAYWCWWREQFFRGNREAGIERRDGRGKAR